MTNQTPEVINLIFLGTGEHRSSTQNALTQLYKHIDASQMPFTRLFDGPAGKPDKNSEHPMPGQYIYNAKDDKKEPRHLHESAAKKFYQLCQFVSGQLVGDGVEDNMMEALTWLDKVVKQYGDSPPKKINLYGFSRGADTAIRISNLLAAVYPKAELNIFAFDPVPGPGRRHHHEAKTIPAAVKKLHCIYAMDEDRAPFEPEDPSYLLFESPQTTQFQTQFYRGVHSDSTKLRKNDERFNSTGKLAWDDLFQFAYDTGTKLENNHAIPNYVISDSSIKDKKNKYSTDSKASKLTHNERLTLYSEMQTLGATPKAPRNFVANIKHYVRDADFFINQEHRELFKEFYPKTFDWFFQGRVEGAHYNSEVLPELRRMQDTHGELLNSLEKKFKDFSKPHGIAIVDDMPIKNEKPLVYDKLSSALFALKTTLNYIEHNPAKVTNYQYIKDCANNINIRLKKIQQLPECNEKDKEIKWQQLIRIIIIHKKTLKDANVDSKFTYMLNAIVDTPEATAYHIGMVIDWNLKHHRIAHDSPLGNIFNETKEKIDQIVQNNSEGDIQKQNLINAELVHAKNQINVLIPPEDQSKKIKTIQKHLDTLSKSLQNKMQYVDRATEQLGQYLFKNKIRCFFQSVLKTFGLPNTLELSKEKQKIAHATLEKLQQCRKTGHGNDKDSIQQILRDALQESKKYRTDSHKGKGSFDSILEQCLNEITSLPSLSSKQTTVETPSPRLGG